MHTFKIALHCQSSIKAVHFSVQVKCIWHDTTMYKIISMQLPAEGSYILGPDVFVVGAAKHAWKPHSWVVLQEWINNEQSHKMLMSIY